MIEITAGTNAIAAETSTTAVRATTSGRLRRRDTATTASTTAVNPT